MPKRGPSSRTSVTTTSSGRPDEENTSASKERFSTSIYYFSIIATRELPLRPNTLQLTLYFFFYFFIPLGACGRVCSLANQCQINAKKRDFYMYPGLQNAVEADPGGHADCVRVC